MYIYVCLSFFLFFFLSSFLNLFICWQGTAALSAKFEASLEETFGAQVTGIFLAHFLNKLDFGHWLFTAIYCMWVKAKRIFLLTKFPMIYFSRFILDCTSLCYSLTFLQ